MSRQLALFEPLGDGIEYDHDFIVNHPIPAICRRGKSLHCRDKVETIHAPQLENVRCFWCGGRMRPVDPAGYAARLRTLWMHVRKEQ